MKRCSTTQPVSTPKASLVVPTQINNGPKKAHAMLSKPMATAWCPTIATGVDPGIYARLIGTLPDITATAARSRPTPQKMLPSDVLSFWNESREPGFVCMSVPTVKGGT